MSKIKKEVYSKIDSFYFCYSFIGVIIALPLILEEQLHINLPIFGELSDFSTIFVVVYLQSFLYLSVGYCGYCLFNTYNKNINEVFKSFLFILNIIDGFLCYSTIVLFGGYVSIYLFDASQQLYYLVGLLFSIFPVVTQFFYYKKIDKRVIKNIITRIFMVLIAGLIIYEMTSCSSGIAG